MKTFLLVLSHVVTLVVGFALGVYLLPILVAPPAPSAAQVADHAKAASFTATFARDRKDSDALHWGEGTVSLDGERIAFAGKLAPGPDYKLYLSPKFVETEDEFHRLKPAMVRVGDVKTFDNFVVALPAGIDLTRYDTVIVWCETFGQFITSGRYR
jgi:hypothetical protein